MPDRQRLAPSDVGGWLRDAAQRLRAAGIEDGAREARLLVEHALGLGAVDILRDAQRPLSEAGMAALATTLARRLGGEPLSRIFGARDFYGRTFHVSPATLDPRPDTETLIEAVLELAAEAGWRQRPARLADIGTGTGCIAITLLAELPAMRAVATDISAAALEVARRNAVRHGVAERLELRRTDLLAGVSGTFDLLVSNPPYISTAEIAGLSREVRDHDPLAALDGGRDGLDFYRRIVAQIPLYVRDGWVVLEVGAGQAETVAGLAQSEIGVGGIAQIMGWRDLGGHQRVVAFRVHR